MTTSCSSDRPLVGVSACLLGEKVRYDGGDKRNAFLLQAMDPHVDWLPVCPEVELGLPVPRDTLRLVDACGEVRLVMPARDRDYSEPMRRWARGRARELKWLRMSGFILKKDSPSCGPRRVKVYPEQGGAAERRGRGLFAEVLTDALPHLPVEDEGRLNDPRLRENFVSHLFAYHHLQQLTASRCRRAEVIAFHEAHKLLYMAHSVAGARRLRRIVAAAAEFETVSAWLSAYLDEFTALMRRAPTVRSHTNVLQHMAGYVSPHLDRVDRAELSETILSYRRGELPLIAPLVLLRHYARKFGITYLQNQVYLHPDPRLWTIIHPF